jgi:murein tripeptide amidase MpaA
MYGRYYYTLSFTYEFQHDEDTVFFANSHPFTYTDLLDELQRICTTGPNANCV